MNCEKCHEPCGRKYQHGDLWVCFRCLPAEVIDQYPHWREREALRQKRSALARQNFGHHQQSEVQP